MALTAWWRRREALPPRLLGGLALFSSLALGPFIHVGGVNTCLLGPWALLRYVPVIGLARAPTRFAIVSSLLLSVLFACGLAALRRTSPGRRRLLTIGVCAALAVELVAIPRPLYSAAVPGIYRVIAADPDRSVRVLELPVGMRDGTTGLGNFNTATQFYQGFHGKAVLGGYLSRVSPGRFERARRMPVMNVLLALSENAEPGADALAAAAEARTRFIQTAHVGYVVIDTQRVSPRLRRFALEFLELEPLGTSDGLELYRPRLASRQQIPAVALGVTGR